jgi:hypothetical protein
MNCEKRATGDIRRNDSSGPKSLPAIGPIVERTKQGDYFDWFSQLETEV